MLPQNIDLSIKCSDCPWKDFFGGIHSDKSFAYSSEWKSVDGRVGVIIWRPPPVVTLSQVIYQHMHQCASIVDLRLQYISSTNHPVLEVSFDNLTKIDK